MGHRSAKLTLKPKSCRSSSLVNAKCVCPNSSNHSPQSQLSQLATERDKVMSHALQGLQQLDISNLSHEVARKLITALRPKKWSMHSMPRQRAISDPKRVVISLVSSPLPLFAGTISSSQSHFWERFFLGDFLSCLGAAATCHPSVLTNYPNLTHHLPPPTLPCQQQVHPITDILEQFQTQLREITKSWIFKN